MLTISVWNMKQDYLYHYTGVDTLLALLHHSEKGKDGMRLKFRASNIYRLNDPKEMVGGYEIIKKILPQYEKMANVPEHKRLSDVYTDTKSEQKCKDDYLFSLHSGTIENGHIPYVISFSRRRDYLPMWSLYGKAGYGVCLKFSKALLVGSADNSGGATLHGDIIYSNYTKEVSKRVLMKILYDCYMSAYEKPSIEDKIFELATLCLALSPFIKHNDYLYEKEFRTVVLYTYRKDPGKLLESEDISDNVDFFSESRKIHPFINYSIPFRALKEIIVGPCADYDVIKSIADLYFDKFQYHCKITKSKVAYLDNKMK